MNILTQLTDLEKESEDFGFYWPNAEMIIDQIKSETREIEEVIAHKESKDRLQEEIGDLIHAAFSLCIFLGFDAEETLKQTTEKYGARFNALKNLATQKGFANLHNRSVKDNLKLWEEVKSRL